jgi:hypothetical protein
MALQDPLPEVTRLFNIRPKHREMLENVRRRGITGYELHKTLQDGHMLQAFNNVGPYVESENSMQAFRPPVRGIQILQPICISMYGPADLRIV